MMTIEELLKLDETLKHGLVLCSTSEFAGTAEEYTLIQLSAAISLLVALLQAEAV